MSDVFSEFMSRGTVRREVVTLYSDQAAMAEMVEIASIVDEDKELSGVDAKALKARWDDAKGRRDASRITVTLGPFSPEIRRQLNHDVPMPKEPRPLGRGATQAQQDAHDRAVAKYVEDTREALVALGFKGLSYAIERVEGATATRERKLSDDGEVVEPAMTEVELELLAQTPHGDSWIGLLNSALDKVNRLTPEVDRFLSLDSSGTDPA